LQQLVGRVAEESRYVYLLSPPPGDGTPAANPSGLLVEETAEELVEEAPTP
jgi:hypothetical protein